MAPRRSGGGASIYAHYQKAGAAAGRTFPSAAGFHTVELFFTDDSGVYFFPTRDAGALAVVVAEVADVEAVAGGRHPRRARPERQRATYNRRHGVRYLVRSGCGPARLPT